MKSYEDLQNRIEILEDDKRVFIEECNRLRKESIRLKSAIVVNPLLCDVLAKIRSRSFYDEAMGRVVDIDEIEDVLSEYFA